MYLICLPLSKQRADPRRQRGNCGEYDQQLYQLAFDIKAVLHTGIHAFYLGVVILKKFELDKKKIIKTNHIIEFVF